MLLVVAGALDPTRPRARGAKFKNPLTRQRVTEALDGELPRKVRRKMTAAAAEQRELLLTMPEVREVVQRALELQEQRLRVEYDAVLLQQLREQAESFSRFNREHVSRQISSR